MRDLLKWELPDPEAKGSHVLVLHRTLPFGGMRATAFFVDGIRFNYTPKGEKPFAIAGVRKRDDGTEDIVVMVPGEAAYILVERDRVHLASMAEVIRDHAAEREELKALEKEMSGPDAGECPPGCTHDEIPTTMVRGQGLGQYL